MWSRSAPSPLVLPPEPRIPTPGMVEARAARETATAGLLDAISRGPEVRSIVAQVREHGARNHFIELLDITRPRREAP